MGDAIREQSDDEEDPREEFLVEYEEETQIEIQDIQLEVGSSQYDENKNWFKHAQDSQTFLVTPTKVIVNNHFLHLEKQLLATKAKKFKSASRKMTSIHTIIKEIIIPYRKGNTRLKPEFVVLDDAHIQGFLLRTDCQRMYGIDICNCKNRHITIGTNKEKKFIDIYQMSTHDPPEELLNEFRVGQFSTSLTNKQELSLLKMQRKDRPAFSIGEEPLEKIRDHDIESYLDV
ncbi:hypothetical protein O181_064985 [Austropuccinia psidii MF-1]|uniref:Uncharacterized protein n=1 Tax=Austropuccinia psidii MF-1 TaxID=1389203 RepID=A0A9Q3ELH2_9BASI|nr:hypothetical protein [Austropuccinia psidii MF-1]